MASIRAILWKKKKSAEEHPIVIRITKNRRSAYFFTGQYIASKFWDKNNRLVKSAHPNSARLNQLILKKLTEINRQLLESEAADDYESISTIKERINKTKKADFFVVAERYIDDLLESEKYRQYNTQKTRVQKFKVFVGKHELPFNEITVSLLKKFEANLLYQEKKAPRTVANYLMVIRTIYNRGITGVRLKLISSIFISVSQCLCSLICFS